jgi:hypothetical protein
MTEDPSRLRRFGIVTGLALLTYAAAGISIESNTTISAFGISFQIRRPDLLPIALVLTSLYATLRFYYYAMMLGASPYRKRRDILDALYAKDGPAGRRTPMYFGPSKFETSPWSQDHAEVEQRAEMLRSAFPRFAGARVTARPIDQESTDDDGETYLVWAVECHIPLRCRIASLVEDFDYALPLWLNLGALAWFTMQLFM